jgi:hypothetical protein
MNSLATPVRPEADRQVMAARTGERLSRQVGHTKRERHITILALVAFRTLGDAGWTIDFDPEGEQAKGQGWESIWEYVAWRYPIREDRNLIVEPTGKGRWESARQYADDFRKGFADLRHHLTDDWRNLTLYMIPRSKGGSRIEVITIDPHLQVNPTETAAEIFESRTRKQAVGQIRSAREKLATLGIDTRKVLSEMLDEALAAELPPPKLAIGEG